MGDVLAEIILKNGGDLVRARDGHITEQNIRSVTVTALVDPANRKLVGAHGDSMTGRIK